MKNYFNTVFRPRQLQRIKLFLEHFRSIEAIQMASLSELSSTPGLGSSTAGVIRNYFHPNENK